MTFNRKLCPHCKGKLEQGQRIHKDCIAPWAEAQESKAKRAEEKRVKAAAKVERENHKQRRDLLVKLEVLKKEAEKSFNGWVRLRDAAEGCISCGEEPPDMSQLHAGRDAGHYRSVGAAQHIRYHPDNVHAQCVHCNQYLAGNVVQYRIGLIARIGLERVEAIESDNRVKKWTREELIAIRDEYRVKLKELKASMK